jgi:hypothetical protein
LVTSSHSSPSLPKTTIAHSKVTTLANIRILMDPHAIEDDDYGVTSILTPKETMKMGLKLVGFKRRRIRRVWSRKTNIDLFSRNKYSRFYM